MRVFIPDARIDGLITEDMPYVDLTTEVLGFGDVPAEIEYFTREDCVLCGVEEAARVIERLGGTIVSSRVSGDAVAAGESFLVAQGAAPDLHAAWKVSLNLLDHLSAVATKTRNLVDAAHGANPACEVLTTRKSMPGVKDLLTKAVTTGGAFPHRLGLSETVLVFAHHITFMGGFDAFMGQLPDIKRRCIEKKVFVEADAEQALALAKAGIDGIQFDKVPTSDLAALVEQIRGIDDRIVLLAAGGINPGNAASYAACGVDGLVTTAPFTAKPIDMSVRFRVR